MKIKCRTIKSFWFFFWGNTLGRILYDKKYLSGKWFMGRLHGFNSIGWRWVTCDAFARLFGGGNKESKYPINSDCTVIHPSNIIFDHDELNNFQMKGSYYQAIGTITIGKGVYIANNVGLITANHDPNDLNKHLPPKPIVIGENCWIGMNSVILPGVELGENTIVGAGSIVTKSFPLGHCIIAGNPAQIIKMINSHEGKL